MRPRRRCSCDRQRVPRRRACVGDLCGFRGTVERRTRQKSQNRTLRRRAGALRERQAQKETAGGRLSAEEKPQAARQEKGLALFCARPATSARSADSCQR